jgi:hypothetical protein
LKDSTWLRISAVLMRLYKNPLFMTLYVLVYLAIGLAIAYLWHVREIFKILAIIILIALAPDLKDLADSWRRRTRGR